MLPRDPAGTPDAGVQGQRELVVLQGGPEVTQEEVAVRQVAVAHSQAVEVAGLLVEPDGLGVARAAALEVAEAVERDAEKGQAVGLQAGVAVLAGQRDTLLADVDGLAEAPEPREEATSRDLYAARSGAGRPGGKRPAPLSSQRSALPYVGSAALDGDGDLPAQQAVPGVGIVDRRQLRSADSATARTEGDAHRRRA